MEAEKSRILTDICSQFWIIGKLILNMMVSVAQFEREMMKERQVEGIKRAQAEGKYKGRVPTVSDRQIRLKRWLKLVCSVCRFRSSLG